MSDIRDDITKWEIENQEFIVGWGHDFEKSTITYTLIDGTNVIFKLK